MDPGTIVGVASAAIAFLDFAIELVKGTHEIYSSLNGSSDANAHVDLVISDLHTASGTLIVQNTTARTGLASQHEKALAELSAKCHRKCIELLNVTKKLKIHDRSKWSSFNAAWKLHWKKDDIDHMHGELRDYRLAILLRLNQMQIENAIQADEKLDSILLEFRRPIRDKHEIEASICSRIKHQLYFKSLHRREDDISEPGEGTCSWITYASMDYRKEQDSQLPWWLANNEREARSHARSEYMAWLGAGAQALQDTRPTAIASTSPRILHISGKAGSGKSTLMRYLFRHRQTRTALEKWAGTRTLVLASFYFWVASGDDMQKSLNGLYRTILHDVIDQCPELTVYLFSSQWHEMQRRIGRNEETKDSADAVLFRDKAISDAFLKLVGPAASNGTLYCFCFFIDGLDEFRERAAHGGGDSKDLSPGFKRLAKELLRWNTSAHVKICTTSRPYSEFLDPLNRISATVLHLENVNQCDIYRHCRKTFDDDDDIADMQISYDDLLLEITTRAEGVFLWAVLTVRAVIKSLSRGDSKEMQMQKLDAIPAELDSLYAMLLSQVDESDRERSNQLFLLALFLSDCKEIVLSGMSCLDDLTDPDFPDAVPLVLAEADGKKRETQGRRLLSSLTHGMVVNHLLNEMTFSHRTAYDYMKQRRDRGMLTSAIDQIDIRGRIYVGGLCDIDDLFALVHDFMSEETHCKCTDTFLRLSKRLLRIFRARLVEANPNTATIPTVLITNSLALNEVDYFYTCTSMANTASVPFANHSILCLAGIFAITVNEDLKSGFPDNFSFVPRDLLTKEEIFILALAGIVSIYELYCDDRSMWTDSEMFCCLDWVERFVFDFDDVRSDALPCPHWMYLAVAMVNFFLDVCVFYWDGDVCLSENFIKTKALPSYATKCKVALNDKRGTVVMLQQLLEVKLEFSEENRYDYIDLDHNDRLEEVVKYILREPLFLANCPVGAGQDHGQDDEQDLELLDSNTFIKYIEYEGFRLDADFKIYLACPDILE